MISFSKPKVAGKKFYRINQYIRAPKLRVIDEEGKQVGVLSLDEALEKARENIVDLVEIAPTAQPPVAKLIDFKKFLYQEGKRERKSKKGTGGEVKGIRLSPFIAQADFEFRAKRAEEFLKEGNKVRVAVRFLGRHLGKKEFGYKLLGRFKETLSEISRPEGEPKWLGRELILTLSPTKGEKNVEEKNENQKINRPPV